MAVAAVALGQFVISVPARYAQLAHPTAGVRAALVELGLSAGGYALYNVVLDTVFVSVFAVVAIVIFWRRPEDLMVLLVATMLVVWGPLNGLLVLTPSATEGMYPALQATLGLTLTYVGYMAWMLFFYLFPSGHFVPRWTRWLALLYGVGFFGLWNFTPFGPPSWPPLLFNAAVLVVWCSFPVAQLYRYARVSDRTQRQQTKWVVFGVAIAIAGTLTTIFTVGAAVDLPPEAVGPRMLSMLLMDAFMLFIPLSIGVAVLRARLFDNRRDHKPYPRLRFSHCDTGAPVLRGRNDDPVCLPNTHRPREASTARHRGFYPCHSSPVQSVETAYPVVHRSPFLPQQIRREEDARRFLRQTEGRDRPAGVERRTGRGGKGDDATDPRLTVVAFWHRPATRGRRLADFYKAKSLYVWPGLR